MQLLRAGVSTCRHAPTLSRLDSYVHFCKQHGRHRSSDACHAVTAPASPSLASDLYSHTVAAREYSEQRLEVQHALGFSTIFLPTGAGIDSSKR